MSHYSHLLVVLLLVAPLSCSRNDALSPITTDDVKILEKYTIESTISGNIVGKHIIHVRDYGRMRVEIHKVTTTIGKTSKDSHISLIHDGKKAVVVDHIRDKTTITEDQEYYARMESRISNPELVHSRFAVPYHAKRIDRSEVIEGHKCYYWELDKDGFHKCATRWGEALRVEFAVGTPVQWIETATRVRIGYGGPDEAFEYSTSDTPTSE